jgi:TolB protein
MSRLVAPRSRGILVVGLWLAAALAVVIVVTPARATFPGTNGRIVFSSNKDGNFELYSMNPDGTGVSRLTNNTADDINPDVSPDGSKIAFASNRDGNYEIYEMNFNGTSPVRITNNPSADLDPAWSPDGSKIVFEHDVGSNFDIFVMDADGFGPVNITNNPATDGSPAWSPSGTRIAFSTDRDGNFEIYTMNTNGTGLTRMTNDPDTDEQPGWSPDGTSIIFDSDRNGDFDIFKMNLEGVATELTDAELDEVFPVFSPDGHFFAYSIEDGDSKQIVTKRVSLTATTHQITNTTAINIDNNWQPLLEQVPSSEPGGGGGETPPSSTASSTPTPTNTQTETPGPTPVSPPPDLAACDTKYEGWFEPTQAVWQDDPTFADKATKQLTETDPRSYNAELVMITNKQTLLYGVDRTVKPDGTKVQKNSRHTIVIKGTTKCKLQAAKAIRFSLTQGQGTLTPTDVAAKGKVPLQGPAGGNRVPFSVTIDVKTPLGVPATPFQLTAAGPYTITGEAIDATGNRTGLIVTVSGRTVTTMMPSVHFVPIVLTDKSAEAGNATKLQAASNALAAESEQMVPDYYPVVSPLAFTVPRNLVINAAQNGDGDLRRTRASADAKFDEAVKKIYDKTGQKQDAKLRELRREEPTEEITRQLAAGGYLAGAGRVIGVVDGRDFDIIAPSEKDEEGHSLVPRGVATSHKVIFVRSGVDQWTVGHELAHTFPYLWTGRVENAKGEEVSNRMVTECGLDYHNSNAAVAHGLRVTESGVVKRSLKEKNKSVMGRAGATPKWIDQCTYWHLADILQQAQDPQMLLVQGVVVRHGKRGSGQLFPAYETDGQSDLQNHAGGRWAIELHDSAGMLLGRYPFRPVWVIPDTSIKRLIRTFTYHVPELPGTASITLTGPGGELDHIDYSANAPQVTITSPHDGTSVDVSSGIATIDWTGSDADGDPLLYTVLLSSDGGATWIPVAFEKNAQSWDVPIFKGHDYIAKVIATDGVRTTSAQVHFTGTFASPSP